MRGGQHAWAASSACCGRERGLGACAISVTRFINVPNKHAFYVRYLPPLCCFFCFFSAAFSVPRPSIILSVVLQPYFCPWSCFFQFLRQRHALRPTSHKDMEQLRQPTHPKSGAIHMQVALGSELRVHDDALPRSLGVVRPGVKTRCLRIFNHVAQAPKL